MTKTKLGFVIVILGLIIGSVTAIKHFKPPDQPKTTEEPTPSLSVKVITPALREFPLSLSAYGSVAAWQEAIIGAEVNGLRLADVRAQVGETVRKGQVLAVFDDKTVLASVAQSRAAMAEAEANLAEARLKSEHSHQVAGTGAMSEMQVVQYLTGEKTAQARLQSAKAQLDTQLLQQNNTRVSASDDGVVSSRTATLGAVVNSGQELFRLIRQNRLEWRAEVTTDELARLKLGISVTVTPPGFTDITGKIRAIAPTMDAQNRKALVYVDLPGAASHGLRPGMFAQGEFHRGVSTGLGLAHDAIFSRDGFSYVFRLGRQTGDLAQVTQVKVQTGRHIDDWVEILSGLNQQDRIVASGAAFLSDGDRVKVVQP